MDGVTGRRGSSSGIGASTPDHDGNAEQRRLVDAFLAAARSGDLDGLLAVLDPGVVLRADRGGPPAAATQPAIVGGAAEVARQVLARAPRFARFARPAIVNGTAGLAIAPPTRPIAQIGFTGARGRIVAIDLLAER